MNPTYDYFSAPALPPIAVAVAELMQVSESPCMWFERLDDLRGAQMQLHDVLSRIDAELRRREKHEDSAGEPINLDTIF